MDDVEGLLHGGEPVGSALSELFIDALPIDGASVSVVGMTGVHSVISSSGATAAVLEKVQFGLGEGPHWEVLATGEPVLVGDTGSAEVGRWPGLAEQVTALNIGAMFSYPMRLGAAVVGVVDLCRSEVGDLSREENREAGALTRAVTRTAVHVATDAAYAAHPHSVGTFPEMRREVHQATGMLAAQLGSATTITDAFATMRAFAFAHDLPLEDVASDIVGRRLDLTEPIP